MSVTQDIFEAALLDPAATRPAGLSDGFARPAGRRFDVYRNNVAVSLTEAMHTAFPVIAKLLGPQNMDGLAGLFLRAHPPSTPLMMHYGDAFPDFLSAIPQLSHLGYLADVARLELALRRSYHAADAEPIDPAALAALDAAALDAARLSFAPAMQLLRSPWPVHDIWVFNTRCDAPPPRAEAQDVIITRPEFDPLPALLPPGGADWIAALQGGASFARATETAERVAPGFDLAATLTLLLQGGAITALTLPDARE